MARPRRCRFVQNEVGYDYFKPQGVALNRLLEVRLNVEELEAVRLKDMLGLEQEESASSMKISQPTFHRILKEARQKIADALINGKAIRIHGGVYTMPNKDGTGPQGKGPRTGMRRGNCAPQEGEIVGSKQQSYGRRRHGNFKGD